MNWRALRSNWPKLQIWQPLTFHQLETISGLNHPVQLPDQSILMLGHRSSDVFFVSKGNWQGVKWFAAGSITPIATCRLPDRDAIVRAAVTSARGRQAFFAGAQTASALFGARAARARGLAGANAAASAALGLGARLRALPRGRLSRGGQYWRARRARGRSFAPPCAGRPRALGSRARQSA